MKAVISICIGLLMLGITTIAVKSAEMGIAGAWLFDEGSGDITSDSVGNNDGEIQGNLDWVTGMFGSALEYSGAFDSYVTIPHQDVLDSVPYTITVWTKLQPASYQYIIWKDGLVWPEVHLKRHIDIWVHSSHYVVVMWHTEAGVEKQLPGTVIVADGEWHHVAKSYDGDMVRLFIDGVLDVEAPTDGDMAVNGEDPMWVGARPGNVAATGIIDEVGFFTEALSEAQLASVMNDGLGTLASVEPCGKLTATWGELKTE